jgi:Ring finger domain
MSSTACIFCDSADVSGQPGEWDEGSGGGASTNRGVEGYGQYSSFAPTPTPFDLTSTSTSSGGAGSSSSSSTPQPMDILASVFFVVAAAWLLIALLYAVLAMTFLRIRVRGNLDRIYDEDFGRVRLFGNVHLRFGWVLRRYIQHMLRSERQGGGSMASLTRFMTRDERRTAMKVVLGIDFAASRRGGKCAAVEPPPAAATEVDSSQPPVKESDVEAPSSPVQGDSLLDEEPVCSICLGEYEDDDHEEAGAIFQSTTCPHRFHSDCILDWLQRQANLECPCCRIPMVDEDDVWRAVKRIRRDRKKELKRERRAKQRKQRGEGAPPQPQSSMMPDSTESSSSSLTDDSEGDAGIVTLPDGSAPSRQSLSSTCGGDVESQIRHETASSTADDDEEEGRVINL